MNQLEITIIANARAALDALKRQERTMRETQCQIKLKVVNSSKAQ
jgi:hypothetical protein